MVGKVLRYDTDNLEGNMSVYLILLYSVLEGFLYGLWDLLCLSP